MSKFWHILSTVGVVALTAFTPAISAYVSGHKTSAVVIGTAWTILGNILQSPTAPVVK